MKELSDILSQEDIQVIEDETEDRSARIYLQLLKKKHFQWAFILYKIRKLYKNDELYFYLRFPRCKNYLRFRKPGYRWKSELHAQYELIWEIKQLRIAVEGMEKQNFKDEDKGFERD